MTLRYAVGIDLGTSNSALAFADLSEPDPGIHVFEVPQLVDRSLTQPHQLLPSHLYLPSPHEGLGEVLVGTFARDRGAQVPGRHVASAKSWLCHPSVDRTAEILPWGAPPDVPRLSPVTASARILRHLRDAWDGAHPEAPLGEQDLVVTVPASFDEGARALTLRAAEEAGLPNVILLEEPQAAFYDWTRVHRGNLEAQLGGVHLILVVDVGGGTTDLTLIRTRLREDTAPVLERIAVGDHVLLGGDNMDLALARVAEQRLGQRLNAAQFGALVQSARVAKELLLADDAPERTTLAVAGAGSRLIGGALSTELARDEVRALLVDGFFPRAAADDAPARSARTAGLAELGLPYAADPAITRHAAAFLKRHARTAGELRVDGVLYNGGALTPKLLADRLTEVISGWVGTAVRRLRNDAPDLAVARGAAAYALVRRGLGLRIGGGSPRTYYVGDLVASVAAQDAGRDGPVDGADRHRPRPCEGAGSAGCFRSDWHARCGQRGRRRPGRLRRPPRRCRGGGAIPGSRLLSRARAPRALPPLRFSGVPPRARRRSGAGRRRSDGASSAADRDPGRRRCASAAEGGAHRDRHPRGFLRRRATLEARVPAPRRSA